ncbi:MAG: DUF1080 domain-containing protein [Verrucomicrobia bacterium]|nr:DUF1080 domain-containing protein [Verrucomicrobiota bacterium]
MSLNSGCATTNLNQVSESQEGYIERYKHQTDKVAPEEALLNTDPEPDLNDPAFVDLYNGEDLSGWIPRRGECTFEATGDKIVGTVVRGSQSTYLSTEREDYDDFIFTAELYWEVNSNSGIMIRAQREPGDKFERVFGPQVEMEGFGERGWSGGIYGQSIGGWRYPMWLEAHAEARQALKEGAWNRVTILCEGPTIKTWINGVPAAHWKTEKYREGYIGLQIHSGKKGEVHFRNIRIKELESDEMGWMDLFESGDFSAWQRGNGKEVSSNWSIEDGIIHRSGLIAGSIVTRQSYEDFELRFHWKISEAGNSGVKYRFRDGLGPEYQILDDARHRDGAKENRRTASLYDVVPADLEKPLRKPCEWNAARIIANGPRLQHWLNGVKVVDTTVGSEAWNTMFAQSKFPERPDFATGAGRIQLQDHRDKVWFKEVHIREL